MFSGFTDHGVSLQTKISSLFQMSQFLKTQRFLTNNVLLTQLTQAIAVLVAYLKFLTNRSIFLKILNKQTKISD